MTNKQNIFEKPYLNATETMALIGYQKTQFHHLIKKRDDFPKAYELSKRKHLWKKSEIEEWLEGSRKGDSDE